MAMAEVVDVNAVRRKKAVLKSFMIKVMALTQDVVVLVRMFIIASS